MRPQRKKKEKKKRRIDEAKGNSSIGEPNGFKGKTNGYPEGKKEKGGFFTRKGLLRRAADTKKQFGRKKRKSRRSAIKQGRKRGTV